jgi:hypothetical protein
LNQQSNGFSEILLDIVLIDSPTGSIVETVKTIRLADLLTAWIQGQQPGQRFVYL